MDDDPEPEQLLEGHEMREQVLSPGGLQKPNAEHSEESSIHQEGGDNGPNMEQEPTKKPIPGKEAPEQTLQMGSKDSIFQRKELKDQSQPSDLSSNVKGSTTPPRKASRRSVQRLPGQDSRWGSPQTTSPQAPLSQKSSQFRAMNETESKDVVWVRKRTEKLMACESQQTIWERKVVSEIIHDCSKETETSRGEDMTNTKVDVEAPAPEETAGPKGQQPEEKASRHGSQQRDSHWGSQRSINEPLLLIQKNINLEEEDTSWINRRTGKKMKNKAQQTSVIWELKTLSEILRSQDSLSNMETDTTEAEDTGETEAGSVNVQESQFWFQQTSTGQASRRSSKQMEPKPSRPEVEPEEEPKPSRPEVEPGEEPKPSRPEVEPWEEPKPSRPEVEPGEQPKPSRPEVEPGEELATEPQQNRQMYKADQAQQTESTESLKTELFDYLEQGIDSGMASTTSLKGSCYSSQKTDGSRSRLDSWEHQSQETLQRDQFSPSLSQEFFGPESKMAAEPQEVRGSQSEQQLESPQGPPCGDSSPVQEKSGSICLPEDMWVSKKTGKVVRNQFQQTDRSWLQYSAAKMMKVKMCRSQQTDESFLQRYSTRMSGSWESLPGCERRCSACDEGNATPFEFNDVELTPVASGSSTAFGDVDTEGELPSGPGVKRAEWQRLEEDSMVEWPTSYPGESPGDSATENMSSYVEGEDSVQQTYSVISLEDGIWMNRKTGKILVSRSHQTSLFTLSTAQSATVLRKAEHKKEAGAFRLSESERNGYTVDLEAPELEETQPETLSRQGSRGTDDTEKLLSRRLSEAMLLCLSYPDLEGERGRVYTFIEEGSWMNVNTGRVLVSRAQQTREDSGEDFNSLLTQLPGGEGMDDDPGAQV